MFKETKWQYLYPFTNGAPLYTLSKVRMTEPYLCVVLNQHSHHSSRQQSQVLFSSFLPSVRMLK